jgi:hypothetical protein
MDSSKPFSRKQEGNGMTAERIIDELIPLRKSQCMTIRVCLFINCVTTWRQGSIRSIALVGFTVIIVVGWFRHGRVCRTAAVRRRQYGDGGTDKALGKNTCGNPFSDPPFSDHRVSDHRVSEPCGAKKQGPAWEKPIGTDLVRVSQTTNGGRRSRLDPVSGHYQHFCSTAREWSADLLRRLQSV